jgi:radical SAM-linked protein
VRNRLYDRDAPAAKARAVVSARPRPEASSSVAHAAAGTILDTRLPAEQRLRLRVRYARLDRAALLSHLETVSVLQRAIRRAGLPALHTSGFNPHLKLTFTDPNPVGMESDAEVFELEVRPPVDTCDVRTQLHDALPEGFNVHSVERVPPRSPSLGAVLRERIYRVSGLDVGPAQEAVERLREPLVLQVERRKGVREVDVARVVRAEALDAGGLMLTLEQGAGLRLREVVSALVGEPASAALSVRKVAQNVASWPPAGGKP